MRYIQEAFAMIPDLLRYFRLSSKKSEKFHVNPTGNRKQQLRCERFGLALMWEYIDYPIFYVCQFEHGRNQLSFTGWKGVQYYNHALARHNGYSRVHSTHCQQQYFSKLIPVLAWSSMNCSPTDGSQLRNRESSIVDMHCNSDQQTYVILGRFLKVYLRAADVL